MKPDGGIRIPCASYGFQFSVKYTFICQLYPRRCDNGPCSRRHRAVFKSQIKKSHRESPENAEPAFNWPCEKPAPEKKECIYLPSSFIRSSGSELLNSVKPGDRNITGALCRAFFLFFVLFSMVFLFGFRRLQLRRRSRGIRQCYQSAPPHTYTTAIVISVRFTSRKEPISITSRNPGEQLPY